MRPLFVFNHIELLLAGATTLLCIIQILYYTLSYARPLRKAKQMAARPDNGVYPPVSIIVYSKNESENLRKHLPALLSQDYPEFEVIVINDGSTDESDDVLKLFENEHKHLYHTYIPEDAKYLSRKKLSLTVGIKAAKYDTLLFTEANCRPLTSHWIAAMVSGYRSKETKIVLGFCAYNCYKGFFHKQVAYDNLLCGLEYLSSAQKHHPYAGNGRNLSYRKELFFQHKGYSKFLNLHAGDDDLFVNESATPYNTEVEYRADSLTEMAPIDYFSIWKEMKASRAATRKEYKGGQISYYRAGAFLFFLYLIATILSIVFGVIGNVTLCIGAVLLYLLRLLIKGFILKKSSRLLGQKSLMAWTPLLEITTPLFAFYIQIYRLFKWKKDYTFRLGNAR